MGSWRPSGDHLGTGPGGSVLRVNSGQFGSILDPYLRNLIELTSDWFIGPWVGLSLRNMTKYGSREGPGRVPV